MERIYVIYKYWFIILPTGFPDFVFVHEQHGLVALRGAGSTTAIASKQCDVQQQHWRMRGVHQNQMVADEVNGIARWIPQTHSQ